MEIQGITIKQIDNYTCVDQVIHSIAKWRNLDYQLMFAESWGLKYSRAENIGEKFTGLYHNIGEKYLLLKEYHGIEINEFTIDDHEKTFNFIKTEILNCRPVVITIDNYWCPWNFTEYNKTHIFHWLLVIGIDEEKDELICVDSQFAIDGKRLDKEHFNKGCSEYASFKFVEPTKEGCVNTILQNSLNRIYNENANINMFKEISELSEDFIAKLNLAKEIAGYENNPVMAPFFHQIHEIAYCRKHFAITLNYLREKESKPELIPIIDMLNLAGDKWRSIFGVLIKACFMDNQTKAVEKVANKLIEIATFEQVIATNIQNLINTGYTTNIVQSNKYINCPDTINEYSFIDLNAYFNNKGVNIGNKFKGSVELSNPNRYIIFDSLPKDNILSIENMKFDINSMEFGQLDNIACEGQNIPIDRVCKYLMFLGCAEFGNYYENLQIIYENNEIEVLELEFTSWLNNKTSFDELVAMSGKGVHEINGQVNVYPFSVSLYAKCYKLKNPGRVKQLHIPNCFNIHIFAITSGS